MSDLRDQIGTLSAEEKAELIDALWVSLVTDTTLIQEQRKELDYRIARHEENPGDVTPWEQVKADLFKDR
jgi:putative addiction module component (TIGR02574 family)